MENNTLEEDSQVPLEKVKLNRKWAVWENYATKPDAVEKPDYSKLLKEIFSFNTIIDFWQFWNIYPGAIPENIFFDGKCTKYFFKESYKIIAIGIFTEGIRPEWEDPKNDKGKIFTMEYLVQLVNENPENFLSNLLNAWTKLVLSILGEVFNYSEFINGIRLVDKSNPGKKNLVYRFEVWLNKDFPQEEIEEFKKKLGEEFGCGGIRCDDINTKKNKDK